VNQQLDLFAEELPLHCRVTDLPPVRTPAAKALARSNGPETSKQAAKEIVESGAAKTQGQQILELLQIRKASSLELSRISLKYTSRLSELKKAGHDIRCEKSRNHETGNVVWMYFIPEKDAE
jgi:hypothetical protein